MESPIYLSVILVKIISEVLTCPATALSLLITSTPELC